MFSANTFPDLPTPDWGYSIEATISTGNIEIKATREITKEIYIRSINANGVWQYDWERISLMSDLESKAILTEPLNTAISDLNSFMTLNKRVGVKYETLNKPEISPAFCSAINIGYAGNVFTQVLFGTEYNSIYTRKYVSWETDEWGPWVRLATKTDLAALEARIAALEGK